MAYKVQIGKVGFSVAGQQQQVLSPYTAKGPYVDGSGGWPIPTFNYGMGFRDLGSGGLRQFGGWVREEFLPQLSGRQAARAYREMLDNSSVVGAIMFAITSTMRKVEWRVESASDTPDGVQAQEFVESCIEDMSHTWSDFVVESLSMLGYGYAPHEIVYKRRLGRRPGIDPHNAGQELPKSKFDDGMIGWRRIPLRGQDTILKWFFGVNGEILGLTQQPWTGPIIDLPIEKLLLFRPSSHKNNPEGRSILRTSYRSYYFVKRLEEQEAILFERLSGLPVMSVPNELLEQAASGVAGAVAKLEAYKKIVTNVRIDEQMGLVIPSDMWPGSTGPSTEPQYKFELISPQTARNGVNSTEAINRHNISIMASVMADFLQLGHESRGTQSLAVSKTDMFFQAIEGFLNSNADVVSRFGVTRLWDFNGLDPDTAPEVKPDMAQRMDMDVLSNFILRLSQAGMPLFPDPELETALRDTAGLPDISDPAAYEAIPLGVDAQQQEQLNQQDALEAKANQSDDLQKMLIGSVLRRLRVMNTAKAVTKTPVRKRRIKKAAKKA